MLPPSWIAEAQKAIDEADAASRDQRKAEQNEAGTAIATAIYALRDAQAAQTSSEDTNERISQGINKATLILVAGTVLFTGLSWCALHDQIVVAKNEQRPWIGAPQIAVEKGSQDDTVTFSLIFRNVGKTPTVGLFTDAEFSEWGVEMYGKALIKCAKGKAQDIKKFQEVSSVPGSDTVIRHVSDDFVDIPIARLKSYRSAGIDGCVVYGSPFDSIRHQTGFVSQMTINGDHVSVDTVYAREPN